MVLLYFKATFIYHRRKPATEAEQSPQVVEGKPLLKRGLFGFKSFKESSKIDCQRQILAKCTLPETNIAPENRPLQ